MYITERDTERKRERERERERERDRARDVEVNTFLPFEQGGLESS